MKIGLLTWHLKQFYFCLAAGATQSYNKTCSNACSLEETYTNKTQTQLNVFEFCVLWALMPKARRASRHIATANAERRGARTKLENEDPARARPVEGGKPGLSGRGLWLVAGDGLCLPIAFVRVAALAAREGGFGARSGKIVRYGCELGLQIVIRKTGGGGLWGEQQPNGNA